MPASVPSTPWTDQGRQATNARIVELSLAIAGFLVASVLCIVMIFRPEIAEPVLAKFFLCVVVALYLAIFFFVLWPQPDLIGETPNWLTSKPIKIAGPVVLFFVVLGLLQALIPEESHGYAAIFKVNHPDEGKIWFDSTDTIKCLDSSRFADDFRYHLIPGNRNENQSLEYVFVRFPSCTF